MSEMSHVDHNHGSDHGHDHHAMMVDDFRRRFFVSLILTLPVLILSPTLQALVGLPGIIDFPGRMIAQFLLSSLIFIYGGKPFLTGSFAEVKKWRPGMMTLISLAIGVAYIYSSAVAFGLQGKTFFWELATLIDIMLFGHWIEMRSVMSAGKALEKLAKLLPDEAHLVTEDGTREIKVSQLNPGDILLIKPGERIPADGTVVEGSTSIDESMVTGESRPVERGEGDEVIGGSINGDFSIKVKVEKTGEESFLNQIQSAVKQAQESKSAAQGLADRAAMWLTFTAITAGFVTISAWLLFTGQSFLFSLERMVTVMVITCPHALGLAIPLVVAVYTGLGAGNGFLIRNRNQFEEARNIDVVLFDKTGTLTAGNFAVEKVIVFGELSEKELLEFAGAVEANSEHSIAKAIAETAGSIKQAKAFEAIKGAGARAQVEGKTVEIFSRRHMDSREIEYPKDILVDEGISEEGFTLAFVVIDGRAQGVIALADEVRGESKNTIELLQKMGIECAMITGDNEAVAKRVAGELGLDTWYAEVMPDQKSAKVKELQDQGKRVAMVGDGVNDAPALAQADVGIAIGAGTDVAVETADVVLVKNNPRQIADIILLSKKTRSKMWQNLAWATGYNILAIPLAAGVLFSYGIVLSPAIGALLMSLSTVIVAINARLMKMPHASE